MIDENESRERFKKMMSDPKTAFNVTQSINANIFYTLSEFMNHHPADPDSILGALDIRAVWSHYHKDWPSLNSSPLTMKSTSDAENIEYWTHQFRSLEQEYAESLIKDGSMISWDYSKKLPLIKLTIDTEGSIPSSFPKFVSKEHTVQLVRQYDWEQFIPPFKEFIIQVNKRAYFYIKLIEVTKNGFTVAIDNYIGRKASFIKFRGLTAKYTFVKEPNGYTSMKFDVIECISHEYLLAKNIDKMKWNDKQRQMYSDLLQIRTPEEYTLVCLKEKDLSGLAEGIDPKSDDCVCKGPLGNPNDIASLKRAFPSAKITIGFDKVKPEYDEYIIKTSVPDYFQVASFIHKQLYEYLKDNNIKFDADGIIKISTPALTVESKIAPNLRTLHKEVI